VKECHVEYGHVQRILQPSVYKTYVSCNLC